MAEYAVALDPQPFPWSAGAPWPILLSSESRTFVVFDNGENSPLPGYFGAVEFVGCTAVLSGFPNDEVQHGHRLAGRGLEPYGVHEVFESKWIDELRAIAGHHPKSPEIPFRTARHFVLTFHDSIMEAIATDLALVGTFDSSDEVFAQLTPLLDG